MDIVSATGGIWSFNLYIGIHLGCLVIIAIALVLIANKYLKEGK